MIGFQGKIPTGSSAQILNNPFVQNALLIVSSSMLLGSNFDHIILGVQNFS